MRRLRAPLCLTGLLIVSPALAQDVEPESVQLEETPTAQPVAAEAAPAPAPAASADVAAQGNLSLSASTDTGASAAATGAASGPQGADTGEKAVSSYGGPVTDEDSEWKMTYNGYFRAPMRVGMGVRDDPAPGQSKTTLHSPLVPDDQYLSWQHTNHSRKDWAEMFFGYGNSWAKGVLGLQGYNFTDSSSYLRGTQFGISQGWIEVTPNMPWENIRFKLKAGSFWNRYGQMGRWDAGEFDTYLIGRTHAMGETMRLEVDMQGQPLTLGFEHGIGTHKPDPSIYNEARFTLLHHMHVDMLWDQSIYVGLHFLHSWTQEEARFTGPQPTWIQPDAMAQEYQSLGQPDGKMSIFGAEARFDMPDVFGYFYLGGSYISLKDAVTVAPAVEVIHSFGGGEFNMGVTSNYLDSEVCRWQIDTSTCSRGNGGVLSLGAQYEAKLGDLLGGSPFGEGQDLTMKFYGMWNKVTSDDPLNDGITKFKAGTDLMFDAFPVLAFATRFDYLQPNSSIKEQNFMILSPRVIFRSSFVTHEQISLQFSHYFYQQRECAVGTPADAHYGNAPGVTAPVGDIGNSPWTTGFGVSEAEALCVQPPPSAVTPDGWGATTQNQDVLLRAAPVTGAHLRPDVNVIALEASMWW